ncbi:hypothetical protein FJTKL_12983 [Diaporthe vaccinii]|uniref:Uncharacterized protein n=1 Tax=Diaporthe vaccinii TaxID=105482 RepID=A0ABR4EC53_9PEZI
MRWWSQNTHDSQYYILTGAQLTASYHNPGLAAQKVAAAKFPLNVESLKGTVAAPKSTVCRASLAAVGRLSQAISGWVPPTAVVRPSWWLTGHVLLYSISGLVPDKVYPLVAQFQSPWADGHTAAMLLAAVEVADFSQTMTPSHSWRCPRPSDGESLGMYLV